MAGHWTSNVKLAGSIPGYSAVMQQPKASCSYVSLSIKMYKSVQAKGGNILKF